MNSSYSVKPNGPDNFKYFGCLNQSSIKIFLAVIHVLACILASKFKEIKLFIYLAER